MFETGIEGHYALVDGKKLRYGYTTGTCAAAAAKAATLFLLTGQPPAASTISTPKGIDLTLPVEEAVLNTDSARCAVRKFSGDDPDVTNGTLIVVTVSPSTRPGIHIDGGEGVGRVTKPGLKVPVGAAAINPGPRSMIERAVTEALEEAEAVQGVNVVISVPEGAALAAKTFNPRLGIVGGISILGTSGIVEPMSEEALLDSIRLEIRQRKALGDERLILAPGNYGMDFLQDAFGIGEERIVKISNFAGRALDAAAEAGFTEVLLAGHIGKLVKLAGGIMNTHSREGDGRAELLAGCALRAGCDGDTARAILACVTTDEMLRILREMGLLPSAMEILAQRIDLYVSARVKGLLKVGVLVFSDGYGPLCATAAAKEWLNKDMKEKESKL